MVKDTISPDIVKLARQLYVITKNPPARPTRADWDRMVAVKREILKLQDERGFGLSNTERNDRQRISDAAAKEFLRQQKFYISNGRRWAV